MCLLFVGEKGWDALGAVVENVRNALHLGWRHEMAIDRRGVHSEDERVQQALFPYPDL